MSRWIDADNAIERLGAYLMADAQIEYGGLASENIEDWKELADDILKGSPSIDIVRCSECAYCNVQNTKYLYAICERHGIEFKPFEDDTRTHYCAWGERRTDE